MVIINFNVCLVCLYNYFCLTLMLPCQSLYNMLMIKEKQTLNENENNRVHTLAKLIFRLGRP